MAGIAAKYLRLFKGSKYVLLVNLTDKLFSFIILLLIARNFSTQIYGEVVSVFTLSAIFVVFFDLGLPLFLQRETVLNKPRATEIFSKVFSITLLLFIPYMISVVGFSLILYPEIPKPVTAIIAVTMYGSILIIICSKSLAGLSDFKSQFTSIWISRLCVVVFFVIGLYLLRIGLNILLTSVLLGFAFNIALLLYYLHKKNVSLSFSHFSLMEAKGVLNFSIPLGFAVLFNLLYDKIDLLLVSKFKDFSDAAYYNVGYGLFKSAMLGYGFLLVSGFTHVSSLSRNRRAVMLFFKKYIKVVALIAVVSSLVLFFAGPIAIILFYSEKFSPSIIVLQILAFGLIGNALNNLTGIILNGIGLFKAVMYITFFGLIINILLNIVFIPLFGIKGASIVTVITEYFILVFELYYVLKLLRKA